MLIVGVIADTHGLLRDEALEALRGSDVILHAGDVGRPEILARLERLAPVHAVRGNVDAGAWADALPDRAAIELGGVPVLLHHGHRPVPDEAVRAARIVVQGHSHRASVERSGGRLFLNPGSAGPRRFRLPVTMARLYLGEDGTRVEPIDLVPRPPGVDRPEGR